MTATANSGPDEVTATEMVTGTIDGQQVTVPKGTMIIRAAEQIGVEVPRFCDHPLLEPVAACRQCLIEVEGMPKPQPSCAVPLGDGMVVQTQVTSEVADTAQKGVMEFLLTNHPLDCPVCDKGGECPLQNQAMSVGRPESRYTLPKMTFPKPVSLSAQILLDQERCVNCARCTRFADQIAGDPLIDLLDRGANQHPDVGDEPFDSYFSGNTIQICPVGALTSADYRFRSRPFDLVSSETTCEHCASGCSLRADVRHGDVMRRYAWEDGDVNEDWNCDKGRFAFPYLTQNRLTTPLIREDGQLRRASWPEALAAAAEGLSGAMGRAGVLTGGRLTTEDAYAYARFARVALGTNNIDSRARMASDDELYFLAERVAGLPAATYQDVDVAPAVLLVGLEPEEESPILFLRLRKATRAALKVFSIAAYASEGLDKLNGELISTVPGAEAEAITGLADERVEALSADGAIILVGERLAGMPGAFAAVSDLAGRTGAKVAWVPRRAGERGAVEAGCLPNLLPGGRPVDDPQARAQVAEAWSVSVDDLPEGVGLTTAGLVAAIDEDDVRAAEAESVDGTESAAETESLDETEANPAEDAEVPERQIAALVVAGVEPADEPGSGALLDAIRSVPFVVSLETRPSEITAEADVVLPVAVVTEKAGSFINWEGRVRPFNQVVAKTDRFSDAAVLAMVADRMDLPTAPRKPAELMAEWEALGSWSGARPEPNYADTEDAAGPAGPAGFAGPDTAVLASWRQLLDNGVMQEGEPHLAATMKPSVARLSSTTAAGIGVTEGESVSVSTDAGTITLPLVITDMPDGIVWVPFNSPDSRVIGTLGVLPGDTVRLGRATEVTTREEGSDDA